MVRVLFLCTANSARSQMAEGILRHLAGDRFEIFSAGTNPSKVNPLAIKALGELHIDISDHTSKSLDQFLGQPFDYVITVCDDAKEECPVFHGARQQLRWSIDDPADARGSEEQRLQAFRRARDEIYSRMKSFLLGR
ncbi:MAG: arsenate reductase ArsC [Bacteroidota bacterium]